MSAPLILSVLLLSLLKNIDANLCSSRKVDFGIVCVCNSTYCDETPKVEPLSFGKYQLFLTSEHQPGHNTQTGHSFGQKRSSENVVTIGDKRYQTIIGFGGAFTDATGININSLTEEAQQKLLESYFGKSGIEYSLCRVPIGGTDFSPRPYSYDDVDSEDITLKHFELQKEDINYKIPIIQEAQKLKQKIDTKSVCINVESTSLDENRKEWSGYSSLKEEYYQVLADYSVKFFDEYRQHNIEFWGMTTGNEPLDGFFSHSYSKINALGWIPSLQARWIRKNLAPTLHNRSYDDLKIIIHDDDRLTIPHVVPLILNDEDTLKYVDGVAVHWYRDDEVPIEVLDLTRSDKKDVFLLSSESCIFRQGIKLGSWERAAQYIGSIIEYLQHGCAGWVDWNMALNVNGGPTYIGYEADSPILVDEIAQEFYKQPMFYAMGHFSKFLPPGSVRLDVTLSLRGTEDVRSVAFIRPDDLVAVIFFNNGTTTTVQIKNEELYSDPIDLVKNSITTVLFPVKRYDKTA